MAQARAESKVDSSESNAGAEVDSSDIVESIIFGPVRSRRFGLSLGVDLSPSHKQCNFDCVYCELHKAKPMDSMEIVLPAQAVINAIKMALKRYSNIDVLSFTATGEPTLYPHLYDVITAIAPILPKGVKSLILSNGSNLMSQKRALQKFDMVKFSLDAALPSAFKRVDRPSKSLDLRQILQNIKEFASSYSGDLIAEVLLVQGHNDTDENLYAIAEFLRKISVSRVDLGTIDRPSAYAVKALSDERLHQISEIFSGLPIVLPRRTKSQALLSQDSMPQAIGCKDSRSKDMLLKLIATRPIACDEAGQIFNHQELASLQKLVDQRLITIVQQANNRFYVVNR